MTVGTTGKQTVQRAGILVAVLCAGGLLARMAVVQASQLQSSGTSQEQTTSDPYQRSAKTLYFKQIAESGPKRGQEIYFFKCWACHNEFTIQANPGSAAPFLKLRDLYQRQSLMSGQPVNDQTVAAKIRNGGPGMPAYRHSISDQDMEDLLSYLRSGMCCWDADPNPPNPWYRHQEEGSR